MIARQRKRYSASTIASSQSATAKPLRCVFGVIGASPSAPQELLEVPVGGSVLHVDRVAEPALHQAVGGEILEGRRRDAAFGRAHLPLLGHALDRLPPDAFDQPAPESLRPRAPAL